MRDRTEIQSGLQLFPLMHEIAHLPHQALVPVDNGLRRGPVRIEPLGRHGPLEFPNLLLDLCNAGFEPGDLCPARV